MIRFGTFNTHNGKTGTWNRHFAGWHRDGWIMEFYRRQNSLTEFKHGNIATFG